MSGLENDVLSFRRAAPADVPELRTLAERIWRAVYPAIVGEAQVEYMLARMYATATIVREIGEGVVWEMALLDGKAAGFLAISMEADGRAKLHKLYLLPECHGCGYGQALIARAAALAHGLGAREVWLQVNKRNVRAIRAYERAGFRREREAVFDIGGGFVMDDFVMVSALQPG